MMELFTLGADRGAYTRDRRPRERPRPHRLERLGHEGRCVRVHVRSRRDTTAANKTIFGQTRELGLAGLLRALRQPPAPPVVLRERSSGATSSRRRSTPRPAAGLQALYSGRRDPPGRRGDPDAPGLLRGPAHGQAPGRLQRRSAADARRVHRELDLVDARQSLAGQQLFYPPDVGGWDYTRWLDTATFRARWFIAALVQGPGRPRYSSSASDPADARAAGAPVLGLPDGDRDRRRTLPRRHSRRRSSRAATPRRSSRPRCAGCSRPPPTSRPHERRSTGGARMTSAAATATAPSSSAARSPRPAAACPAIEPGMPLPAGTGLSRRTFVSRRAAVSPSRSTAARALGAAALDDGIARAATEARPRGNDPRQRSSSRAGSTACRCSSRPATRSTASSGRRSRSAAARASPTRSDPPPLLASALRRASQRSTARARLRCFPAIGYANSNQSHFTSRHYWEVGAHRRRPADRLARPLPRPGRRRRQPAAGADARRSLFAGSRNNAKCPSATLEAADQYSFVQHAPAGASAAAPRCSQDRRSRRHAGRSGARGGGEGDTRGRPAARATRPLQPKSNGTAAFTSPVTYPTSTDPFPYRLRRPRRDDRARPAASRDRVDLTRPVRHALGRIGHALRRPASSPPTRCSRSSAISKPAESPTACSSTSGRSSVDAPPRTDSRAPTTARPGSAS